MLSSDDSSVEVPKKKSTATKRKASANSEASENLLKQKRKQSAEKEKKASKKTKKVESSDDESSDAPVVKAKAKKVAKKVESDDSSDDEPKKVVKVKATKAKKAESSDDESSDVPQKKAPVKAAHKKSNASSTKKQAKKADSSDEEEVVVKKQAPVAKVAEVEDENACRELFVKNMSYNTTQDGLYAHFSQFGSVVNVKLIMDKMTGRPRGFGFVEFGSRAEAKKAMEGTDQIDGRSLTITFSDQKPERTDAPQQRSFGNAGGNQGPAFTVFVGNLGFRTTEDSVRNFFSKAGNVLSVRIAKHEDGRAKGFCHVDFEAETSVKTAIGFAGQDLDGREVRVDASEPRKPREGGFGGGFGAPRGAPRGGMRGGRGGPPRQEHVPMGSTGNKKKFNDSDSD